ncbi:hypothetical protein Sjap_003098 [Stephania japonica]|uniref:CCR4-NOT transcription complex subunit 9 n=1 Tax=Stephania japonica TaxID=461633 RepID=A0AAP0PT69_9MAGN
MMANQPQSMAMNPTFGGPSASASTGAAGRGRGSSGQQQGPKTRLSRAIGARALQSRSQRERPSRSLKEEGDISRSGSIAVELVRNHCCSSAAHIPLYLYPFLNTTSKTRPFEYLRLTSLGVIGALVKVATFIVQKILLDDIGLHYICATAERFFAVGRVLGTMVASLAEQPSSRLLKHIIRCYLRLSDNPRACEALRNCLPDMLRDPTTFSACLREDPTTKRWLQQLIHNVSGGSRVAALQAGAGLDHMLGNQTRVL